MIDLVFLAFNRLEFTKASMGSLLSNTEWDLVRQLIVYDDGSTDGTREYLKAIKYPKSTNLIFKRIGGPVAITKHYLSHKPCEIFCKIDNDVVLPPFWLSESLKVMSKNPNLDLLGIESKRPSKLGRANRGYCPAKHIGGVGLMRSRCFHSIPNGYGKGGRMGFTIWQWRNSQIVKGWIEPALSVFLLDRLPIEPWVSLSQKYIEMGWQRKWYHYTLNMEDLWSWWKNEWTGKTPTPNS